MKLELETIGRAAQLGLLKACRRIDKGGLPEVASRAWAFMQRNHIEYGVLMISQNAEAIKSAPARKVVRQLSNLYMKRILTAELKTQS